MSEQEIINRVAMYLHEFVCENTTPKEPCVACQHDAAKIVWMVKEYSKERVA